MIAAGMNVARLNFSHGSYRNHKLLVKNIRAASKKLNQTVAVMQDLQGPRIRIGKVSAAGISLNPGDEAILIPESRIDHYSSSKENILPIQYENLYKEVKSGVRILISDGLIELRVKKINKEKAQIVCAVIRGGIIFSYRGMNVPKVTIAAPVITAKDRDDLYFGLKQGIDWVAFSFVKDAKDVLALKKLIKQYRPYSQVKVMAKIERREAVENIDAILKEADGIMVARGDLGIELPPEEVPMIQKKIIAKCLEAAKPVVVATQMLESMMQNSRPTRAEVSDIANAVIDHTDAVMLSGETATGKFPVEAVSVMAKTIERTEKSPYDDLAEASRLNGDSVTLCVAATVNHLAKQLKAKAIVAVTNSGYTAQIISRFRPETKILAMTENLEVARQLALVWGVEGKVFSVSQNINKLIHQATDLVKKEKFCQAGDRVIIVTVYPVGGKGNVDLVKVVEIK